MATSFQQLTRTQLRGEVKRVIFSNSDTGFAVVVLIEPDGYEQVVCGQISSAKPGENIEVNGYFEKHEEYGKRFKVESFRPTLPDTPEGVTRFLAACAEGIGQKTAEKIVDYFGHDAVKILNISPGRLTEVPGIGKKKAKEIAKAWKDSSDKRDSMIFLQGLGITPAYCSRIFKCYGEDAVNVVRSNPYKLADDVDGIGFLKADAIAREMGFAANSVERLTAAASYCLNNLINDGHVCCPSQNLLIELTKLTEQDEATCINGIMNALKKGKIQLDMDMFYTPKLAKAEKTLPYIIKSLASSRKFAGLKIANKRIQLSNRLAQGQREAVESILKYPLNIITGGPGVGKTTVVGEIVRVAKQANLSIALAAPTGRAAKRLSEATGLIAKTIHRLLIYDPATNKFVFDENNQLNCDLLIVDEVSMLDILICQSLFSAIKYNTSVILVGDADQLPSVGPGKVLADFIASNYFHVTKLTEVFRQAGDSGIIRNAHRVNKGLLPEQTRPDKELTDFYWIEQDDPEKATEIISRLITERIPQRFNFHPIDDIQVLTPMNRGNCGTVYLNSYLGSLLNNKENVPEIQKGDRLFKVGDKVMQTSNNYDKGVFNGDTGILSRIETKAGKFYILFEDKEVCYNFEECDQIQRAYAITIHKSQGCEFPCVIMPILNQHYMMLQRNLIYTGMTRAKKLLILVGSKKAVEIAVHNTRIEPRFSLLLDRFKLLDQ